MKPKASKAKIGCKGCELVFSDSVDIDEVVHDSGCIFYDPDDSKTFDERVVEAVVNDIRKGGKIREILLTEIRKEDISA